MGEGEGGTNGESSMEAQILSYAKWRASRNLLCDSGSSNPGLCDKLEGWERLGGGREVQERGDICIPTTDSC